MHALRMVVNDESTCNVQPIIDPESVVDIEDTILDEKVQEHGAVVKLKCNVMGIFGESSDQIYLPPMKHSHADNLILINPLSMLFNNVLRIIEQVEEKSSSSFHLAKSVRRYQYGLISALSGKRGYLNRLCMTSRIPLSLRAVALPNANWSPDWLGVPSRAMTAAGRKHGDLCLAVRFPGVWDGSLEVFRARKSGNDCIEIHPLMHKQFNLDHDGDTMSVYWIPEDKECQAEAEANVVSFFKNNAKLEWPQSLKLDLNESPEILGDRDLQDLQLQTEIRMELCLDGKSVSPVDILKGDVDDIEQSTGKNLREDNLRIVQGLTQSEFTDRCKQVNLKNLVMKMYMGPVGSMANKIKTICANTTPKIQSSGMKLSERIQQSLLDVKHLVGNIEDQKFIKILEVLNRRYDKTRHAMPGKIIEILDSLGIEPNVSTAFIGYVFWTYPGKIILDKYADVWALESSELVYKAFDAVPESSPCTIDKEAVSAFNVLVDNSGKNKSDLSREFWQQCVGINEIIKREYPVFRFIGREPSESTKVMSELAESIFIRSKNDKQGICNRVMKMIRGGSFDA